MLRLFSDPFEALFNLQRSLDALRASDWLTQGLSGAGTYPPLNVFRRGEDFVIIIELPGIQREDVDIEIEHNRVRISGKKVISFAENISLHRRERTEGTFDRTVSLPVEIDADRAKAEYRNGILALLLPRPERDKPKSITIS